MSFASSDCSIALLGGTLAVDIDNSIELKFSQPERSFRVLLHECFGGYLNE
jgi:hypothetical protein